MTAPRDIDKSDLRARKAMWEDFFTRRCPTKRDVINSAVGALVLRDARIADLESRVRELVAMPSVGVTVYESTDGEIAWRLRGGRALATEGAGTMTDERTAIMPSPSRPHTHPPHEAGTTWCVLSGDLTRLATIYRSPDGDHGADMQAEAGDRIGLLIVGGGLPRLPLTRPDDFSLAKLTWEEVALEVAELLESEGWTVLWFDNLSPQCRRRRGLVGGVVGGDL